jgi:hypothetical protein
MNEKEKLKGILQELIDNDMPVPEYLKGLLQDPPTLLKGRNKGDRSGVDFTQPIRPGGRKKGAKVGIDFKVPITPGGRPKGFTKENGLVYKTPPGRKPGFRRGVDFDKGNTFDLESLLRQRYQESLSYQKIGLLHKLTRQRVHQIVKDFEEFLGGINDR